MRLEISPGYVDSTEAVGYHIDPEHQRLYRECYKIARGAPQEFQLLVGEISTLSNSLNILQEEVKDPTSTLVQAGEDRVRMVNEMICGIGETLKRLEKVARKYEILGSNSKRRQIWVKFKWSVEFSNIDALRNKVGVLTLPNSSVASLDDSVFTSLYIITR